VKVSWFKREMKLIRGADWGPGIGQGSAAAPRQKPSIAYGIPDFVCDIYNAVHNWVQRKATDATVHAI
jgi:hypothetical protein